MDPETSRRQPAPRRKAPEARRAEMIEAASAIAVKDGLDKVTARRVAAKLGVFPGLVDHYFTADQLVAAAFGHAASKESNELFDEAEAAADPVIQLRRLISEWMRPERDEISLLWLDAWQASRHRPALREEVAVQMSQDITRLAHVIQLGIDSGQLRAVEPETAATQIFSLVDAVSIQAAIRDIFDYTEVRELVVEVAGQILGVRLRD
jgi:AcrR family transcriptional regulator